MHLSPAEQLQRASLTKVVCNFLVQRKGLASSSAAIVQHRSGIQRMALVVESCHIKFSPPGVTRCLGRLLNVQEHEGGKEEDGNLHLVTLPETRSDFRLRFSERSVLCAAFTAVPTVV